jgi:hypothetical protein
MELPAMVLVVQVAVQLQQQIQLVEQMPHQILVAAQVDTMTQAELLPAVLVVQEL